MTMNRQRAFELKLSGADTGTEPRDENSIPFTHEQKLIVALELGLELTLSQFLKERIFRDPDDIRHFLTHVADFTARIYEGEKIADPAVSSIRADDAYHYALDSIGADIALFAVDEMVKMGKIQRQDVELDVADENIVAPTQEREQTPEEKKNARKHLN